MCSTQNDEALFYKGHFLHLYRSVISIILIIKQLAERHLRLYMSSMFPFSSVFTSLKCKDGTSLEKTKFVFNGFPRRNLAHCWSIVDPELSKEVQTSNDCDDDDDDWVIVVTMIRNKIDSMMNMKFMMDMRIILWNDNLFEVD